MGDLRDFRLLTLEKLVAFLNQNVSGRFNPLRNGVEVEPRKDPCGAFFAANENRTLAERLKFELTHESAGLSFIHKEPTITKYGYVIAERGTLHIGDLYRYTYYETAKIRIKRPIYLKDGTTIHPGDIKICVKQRYGEDPVIERIDHRVRGDVYLGNWHVLHNFGSFKSDFSREVPNTLVVAGNCKENIGESAYFDVDKAKRQLNQLIEGGEIHIRRDYVRQNLRYAIKSPIYYGNRVFGDEFQGVEVYRLTQEKGKSEVSVGRMFIENYFTHIGDEDGPGVYNRLYLVFDREMQIRGQKVAAGSVIEVIAECETFNSGRKATRKQGKDIPVRTRSFIRDCYNLKDERDPNTKEPIEVMDYLFPGEKVSSK